MKKWSIITVEVERHDTNYSEKPIQRKRIYFFGILIYSLTVRFKWKTVAEQESDERKKLETLANVN